MSNWIVEPRDPLIARDGRPAVPGERLSTLPFPHPSVIAGAVRTRLASGRGAFELSGAALDELRAIEVAGPLLVALDDAGSVAGWFFPAPKDAVLEATAAGDETTARVRRIAPIAVPDGSSTDALDAAGLRPVAVEGTEPPGKPPRKAPRFWARAAMERWLVGERPSGPVRLADLGIRGPLPEVRTHLALRPGERVGEEGMLFSTSGLRFLRAATGSGLAPSRLGLALRHGPAVVGGRELELPPGLVAPLGGERRLATWNPASAEWPDLLPEVRAAVASTRRARLVLATPAIFSNGALPGWNGVVGPAGGDVRVTVRGACVPRPEIISGWDFAADNGPGRPKGRPKPTRRMAPAGSVYFVELDGTSDAIGAWCDRTWLRAVSDDPQDRRDGFGLALVGTWED